jgi:hypothetical protein
MERSRPERPEWPDLLGWFPGWAHWPGFRGLMESAVEGVEPMRIEEHVEDNQLIVKAELPGIDPDKECGDLHPGSDVAHRGTPSPR